MRNLLSVTLSLAAMAATAAAQSNDKIRFKDAAKNPDIEGEIVDLNYKTVQYQILVGNQLAKQPADAKLIEELVPDPNGKSFDFNAGENAFNEGNWPEAIARFERVRKDPRSREFLRQLSAIYIVRAYFNNDKFPAVLTAAKALQDQKADGYYLREAYEFEIKAHLGMGNVQGAAGVIQTLENKGRADGLPEWARAAETLKGSLFERQNKPREALAIYKKFPNDEDSRTGELRCLVAIADWASAASRADVAINESKGKKTASAKLLTGAYAARGEANLNTNKAKEALFDFLQAAWVQNRGELSLEHEMAVGRASVAAARLAGIDKAKKDLFKQRAQELLGELDKTYPKSRYRDDAIKEIQAIR